MLVLGVGLTVFLVNYSKNLSLRSFAAEPKVPFAQISGPSSANIDDRVRPDDPRFPPYPNRAAGEPTSGLTKQEIEASKQNNNGVTIYQGDNRPKLPAGYSYVDAECSAYQQSTGSLGCINVDKYTDIPAVIWNSKGEVVNSVGDIPKSDTENGNVADELLKKIGFPDFNTWQNNILSKQIDEGNGNKGPVVGPPEKQDTFLDTALKIPGELIQSIKDAIAKMTGQSSTPSETTPAAPAETAPQAEPAQPPGGGLNLQ